MNHTKLHTIILAAGICFWQISLEAVEWRKMGVAAAALGILTHTVRSSPDPVATLQKEVLPAFCDGFIACTSVAGGAIGGAIAGGSIGSSVVGGTVGCVITSGKVKDIILNHTQPAHMSRIVGCYASTQGLWILAHSL